MINIQPVLDEAKQQRGHPKPEFKELRKLFREHGDAAERAIAKHWRNVEIGLTDEYKQAEEV